MAVPGSILLGILWNESALCGVAQIGAALAVNSTLAAGNLQLRSIVPFLSGLAILRVVGQLPLVGFWVAPVEPCSPPRPVGLPRRHSLASECLLD